MNFIKSRHLLFLLAMVLLVAPIFMRVINDSPVVSGERPYHDLVVAKGFSQGLIVKNDFSLLDKYVIVNPYHAVINLLSKLLPLDVSAIIISVASMLLALVMLIRLLESFNVQNVEVWFIVLCFILSPVFISASSFPTYYSFVLFLYLSGLYLFLNKTGFFWQFLTAFIFALNSLFGLAHALMVLVTVIVIVEIFHEGLKEKMFFYIVFVPLFIASVAYQVFIIAYGGVDLELGLSLSKFLSDFGSNFGFGVFTLLSSFVGMVVIWNYKRKYYALYVLIIASIIKSFLVNELIIYSSIAVSVLAGLGFSYFFKRDWEIADLKNVVLLLLFCGLLFSSIAYIKNIVYNNPDEELVDALTWVKENTADDSIVFAHSSYGFWIEYFSDRKVFLDSNSYNSKNSDELINVSNAIFNEYNFRRLRSFLKNYNITHVLISDDLKDGLVWNRPDRGLDFMKSDRETFKRVYNSSHIEVFEVLSAEEMT